MDLLPESQSTSTVHILWLSRLIFGGPRQSLQSQMKQIASYTQYMSCSYWRVRPPFRWNGAKLISMTLLMLVEIGCLSAATSNEIVTTH